MKKKPVVKKMASKAPAAKGKGPKIAIVMPMMFGKKGAKKGCK